jgi:hypothetical protein
MDLQATASGDLAIVNGELAFVTGQDAIAQALAFRLRTFLGESRYNRSAGVPYLQVIFRPGTPLQAIKFILEGVAMGTPGVTGVTLDEPVLDPLTRALTITGKALTIEGDVTFNITIGAEF